MFIFIEASLKSGETKLDELKVKMQNFIPKHSSFSSKRAFAAFTKIIKGGVTVPFYLSIPLFSRERSRVADLKPPVPWKAHLRSRRSTSSRLCVRDSCSLFGEWSGLDRGRCCWPASRCPPPCSCHWRDRPRGIAHTGPVDLKQPQVVCNPSNSIGHLQ